MNKYDKKRIIKLDGIKYTIYAWDVAGFINYRGVSLEFIEKADGKKADGVLLRFNHYDKGEQGKRILMSQEFYNNIAEKYDPCDRLNTWVIPFLEYIGR